MKISAIIPAGLESDLDILNNLKDNKADVNFIIERGPNPSKNRNRGIKKTKTKFVAFLNAHTSLTEDWTKEVQTFFKEYPEIDIVGGPQLTSKEDPIFERASGYILSSIFGTGEARTRYKIKNLDLNANEKHLTSANLICRRKVFNSVLFDENLWPGEDPKFIDDAIKSGFRVAYSPNIRVYQKRRKNVSELFKQVFNYGFTRTKKEGFLETSKKPLFLVPSIFLLYLAVLPTLISLNLIFLAPILIYLSFNILFSLFEISKNKDPSAIFLMPFLFLVVHLSYGFGFIYGLIVKYSLKNDKGFK